MKNQKERVRLDLLVGQLAKSLKKYILERNDPSYACEVVEAFIKSRWDMTRSGKVPIAAVAQKINNPLSHKTVGSVLSNLGFKMVRIGGSGRHARIWDEERVRALAKRFRIPYRSEESERKKPGTFYPSPRKAQEDVIHIICELKEVSDRMGWSEDHYSAFLDEAIEGTAKLALSQVFRATEEMVLSLNSRDRRIRRKAAMSLLKIAGMI